MTRTGNRFGQWRTPALAAEKTHILHIANAELRTKIEITCQRAHYTQPILTTPEELMGTPS